MLAKQIKGSHLFLPNTTIVTRPLPVCNHKYDESHVWKIPSFRTNNGRNLRSYTHHSNCKSNSETDAIMFRHIQKLASTKFNVQSVNYDSAVKLKLHKKKSKPISIGLTISRLKLEFHHYITTKYEKIKILPWCYVINCLPLEYDDNQSDNEYFILRFYYPMKVLNKCFEKMEFVLSVDFDYAQEAALSDPKDICNLVNNFIKIPIIEKPYLLIVNPKSGTQKGQKIYQNCIKEIFESHNIAYVLLMTEKPSHALGVVKNCENLTDYRGIITVSGDGLVYEVFCGIFERMSWKDDLQSIPIGVIAAGSGNGLAASISSFAGIHPSGNLILQNTLIFKDPQIQKKDLMILQTTERKEFLAFLSLTWGLIANVDVGSDKLRWMGTARFNISAAIHIAKLTKFKAKLWYLPVNTTFPKNNSYQYSYKSSIEQASYSKYCFKYLKDINEPIPEDEGWILLDEKFIGIVVTLLPYLASNAYVAPQAEIDDGKIHLLIINSNISRSELLSFISKIEYGTHLLSRYITLIECNAFRLVPECDKCLMAVDGENLTPCPIQGEIIPSAAQIFTGLNSEGELFI